MSRPTKYVKKVRELRAALWPDIDFDKALWQRQTHDGFTTIPRTMPLIMSIIDGLTKGAPASTTYLELWCRAYDEMYVSLTKARELAFHSGFTGQRAERTWAEKIRKLAELGFISVKEGQAGPLSHALILNPYLVIQELYDAGTHGIPRDKMNALYERGLEIGAYGESSSATRKTLGPTPLAIPKPAQLPSPTGDSKAADPNENASN